MKKTLVMAAAAVLTGSMAYPSLAEEYVFEMAPVVVTANRMNENLVDARADISVVTSRQIEKLHLEYRGRCAAYSSGDTVSELWRKWIECQFKRDPD